MPPLPDNLPLWILVTLFILNWFKEPVGSFVFSRFPKMADSHFASIAKDKADRREFEQQREVEKLRVEIAKAEAALKHQEVEHKQQVERERTYVAIIDNQFQFMQKLTDSRLIEMESELIGEMKSIKTSLDRLVRQVTGKATAQGIILDRLANTD